MTFWVMDWFSDISTFKEEWHWPVGILFLVWFAWISGYKYGMARGWAEIELRMLPKEERQQRGYYLDDEECIQTSIRKIANDEDRIPE